MNTEDEHYEEPESFWAGAEIHRYTRKQALEDGVLVDITAMAKEAGISVDVAVTHAVWHGIVVPTKTGRDEFGQDENGRLWDILMLLHFAARDCKEEQIRFSVAVVDEKGERIEPLKAVIGPGDEGEPVITLMRPNED